MEYCTNVIYVKRYLLSVAVLADAGLNMLMESHLYVIVTIHLVNIAVLHRHAPHVRFTIMHTA